MKYSGRINRGYPAGFTRAACNQESTRITLFFAPRAFFLQFRVFFPFERNKDTYPIASDERENKTRIAPNTP